MALPGKKQKALKLRMKGMSYSQIKLATGVSKSTLSGWLSEHPLSEKRIRELRDWNQVRIEKYIKTRTIQRQSILDKLYAIEKLKILPLSKRELFIGGLFLYWGEGSKTDNTQTRVANTDPVVLKIFIRWLVEVFAIDIKKIRIHLHLYKDMDIAKETKYWSNTLRVPINQFRRPYIKDTTLKSLTYKGGFGHGTCNVIVGNATIHKMVLMGLKVLRDHFIHL
jgi:transcriptional regulator with XRE-family HTH domain